MIFVVYFILFHSVLGLESISELVRSECMYDYYVYSTTTIYFMSVITYSFLSFLKCAKELLMRMEVNQT